MDSRELVAPYYRAWIDRAGDMTGVALADDFTFRGPVASFDTADGFRAMARQAGAAVRDFTVRRQFSDGDVVCSIIDWSMEPVAGTMTAAELLTVRDGRIVAGELIYDAEDLRHAMRGGDIVGLLEHGYDATADLLARITPDAFGADSPCVGWTVRQVGNHLVGGLLLLTRVAEGEAVAQQEFNAQVTADTDHLGADPAAALRAVAKRSLEALQAPGVLAREFPFVGGSMVTGSALANISLLESLVHGWDLAHGARIAYPVDDDIVEAVRNSARMIVTDETRAGRFGPAVAAPPGAPAFVALLGHLGRRG